MNGAPQRGVLRDLVANQHQLQVIESALADEVERLDQPLEILVRLHVACVEHELVVQLIALAHPHHVLFARLDAEALVVRVVDDVDLVGLRVDEAQDVALRALRDRQHARRAAGRQPNRRARVREREPVRQVLRKHQVDAVVDRDDRRATDERRQHIVRRVKQRDALALHRQRNRESARRSSSCPPSPAPPGSSRPATPAPATSSRRHRITNSVARSSRASCRSRLRMYVPMPKS